MSPFLKTVPIILFALFFCHKVSAQCNIITTRVNSIDNLTTNDNYEYLRYNGDYFAISVKTTLKKAIVTASYFSTIEYTYNKLLGQPEYISFVFGDQAIIKSKLIFLRSKKTDNNKTATMVYKLLLTDADITTLKSYPVTKALLSHKQKTITILINNTTFLQAQINCLQMAN